jgi:carboxypeptidase T
MRFLFCASLAAAFLSSLSAGAAQNEPLASYRLTERDPAAVQAISRYFEITEKKGDQFLVLVPQGQKSLFLSISPRAELLDPDTAASIRALRDAPHEFEGPGYHSFDQVMAWIDAKAKAAPALASVVDYGKSGDGRPLRALRVSGKGKNKPTLMITAATHGDELITTEVLIALVEQMLQGYGSDARFTRMVDDHEIFFIPVVNPDGFFDAARYDGNRDPNRSYPYPEAPNRQPTPAIQGLVDFFHAHKIAGNIDFHAYGEMVMYPWAYTYDPIAPEAAAKLDGITKQMAATNHYDQGPISKVIYVAPGSSCDYYFWKAGTAAVAIEMGNSKIPLPRQIPSYVESQAESTWRFIEAF